MKHSPPKMVSSASMSTSCYHSVIVDTRDPAGYVDGLNLYAAYFDVNGVDVDGLDVGPMLYDPNKSLDENTYANNRRTENIGLLDNAIGRDFFQQEVLPEAMAKATKNALLTAAGIGTVTATVATGVLAAPYVASAYGTASTTMSTAMVSGGGATYIGVQNTVHHVNRYATNAYNWMFQRPELWRMPGGLRYDYVRNSIHQNTSRDLNAARTFARTYDKTKGLADYGLSRADRFQAMTKENIRLLRFKSYQFQQSKYGQFLEQSISGTWVHPLSPVRYSFQHNGIKGVQYGLHLSRSDLLYGYYFGIEASQGQGAILQEHWDIPSLEDLGNHLINIFNEN